MRSRTHERSEGRGPYIWMVHGYVLKRKFGFLKKQWVRCKDLDRVCDTRREAMVYVLVLRDNETQDGKIVKWYGD